MTPTSDNRCTTAQPVATSTTTCRLQDRRPGFPVLDWSGTWLPGGGLSACRRRQRSPTSISRHSDLCHAPHVQHLRRPTDASQLPVHMQLRNSLPINLSQCHSLEQFKHLLKTWLVAWLSGRMLVFDRRAFAVLRSTYSCAKLQLHVVITVRGSAIW